MPAPPERRNPAELKVRADTAAKDHEFRTVPFLEIRCGKHDTHVGVYDAGGVAVRILCRSTRLQVPFSGS